MMIDTVSLDETLTLLPEVKRAVPVDEPAPDIGGIRTETGIVIHF
jgi:hypothetical protein